MVCVVIIGNNGLGVRGLEKRHGGSSFSLKKSESSDAGVRDAVTASNHFARLHKSHAIFFLDCCLLAAPIAVRLSPLGRLEVDQQTVGCGQVDGILVVSTGELLLEVGPKGAKTATVGSLQENQSESAVTRNFEAFRCVVCVGGDSGSSIQ